ncbi:MAG: DUF4390 domain-containing protein [Sterolibacteriaceae bacterium]|nr:DUF4390 domain-containing protein [Candidatus Methylophosphatis haderslevensis]
MTASISRCLPSGSERHMRRWILAAAILLLALANPVAGAAEPELRNVAVVSTEDGQQLQFDVLFELNPRLEEVVSRGVPLYFVAEFELSRPRWYWFDEDLAKRTLTYRLSYNALTRQYRLATGPLYQNFPTLEAAVRTISRVRSWTVAERGVLRIGVDYQARLRFRLDLAQMPKPFQVGAIGDRDWSLATEWLRWTYVPGAGNTEPVRQ